jgi:hypothetical protein
MPIMDNDLILVNRALRSGSNNIEVNVTWTDGTTGAPKGSFTIQWATAEEFKEWLEAQSSDDLMRSVLLQCFNRNTGALRPAVFDAMPGKTFRVQQRVQEV